MTGVAEKVCSFRAMNTDVKVFVCAASDQELLAETMLLSVQRLFFEVESRLSRFNSESELNRLNASAGQEFIASPLLFNAIQKAVSLAQRTGGVFNPFLLRELIEAGYDRSFEKIPANRDVAPCEKSFCNSSWEDVRLDHFSCCIMLPKDCAVDLGGIGKGLAVDMAADKLAHFTGFAIDAGGDIRAGGKWREQNWVIGITDPFHPEGEIGQVTIKSDVAVCTSTTLRRRWKINGEINHHIIDPRTGCSANSGIVSATVIAGTAVKAEAFAKAALILGSEDGLRLLDSESGVSGVLVREDGGIIRSKNLREKSSEIRVDIFDSAIAVSSDPVNSFYSD
ncbi:MAG: FAD:protein FMN transferase [Dehalococcoidales bacterium]|jgi:thiamine biosynthesis lipoprotein|nr:FAD:protein FMN transferase [Dehalococcoidales bacterium]